MPFALLVVGILARTEDGAAVNAALVERADGRVKLGRKHNVVEVIDVMNRRKGGSAWGSARVIARFRPTADQHLEGDPDV